MSSRREKYFGAVSPGDSPKALFRNAALAEAVDHLAGQADAGVVRRDVLRRMPLGQRKLAVTQDGRRVAVDVAEEAEQQAVRQDPRAAICKTADF